MAKKTRRDPFEVKLSEEREDELVQFLVREIQSAEDARSSIIGDGAKIDQWHQMYENGSDIKIKDIPWPGCANLGSFIVTEKVDAMRARIAATVFSDPIWIVEGWGDAAQRAPFVEAFMQWKAESTKLQTYVTRAIHNSLIEGMGVLEVSDRIIQRKDTRKMQVAIKQDQETGQIILDEDGNEQPVRDEDGKFLPAGEGKPSLEMVVRDVVRATDGPTYRVISVKDFCILPGHAAESEDIWGYTKKVYRRLPELLKLQKDGFYRNVEALGIAGEREQTPVEARQGQDIPSQVQETAEKELYEVLYLADLDDDGFDEWYIVTLSVLHRVILRLQYQDYGTPHYVRFVPFPRPTSVWGYSFAGEKLGSLYDEHAALRNMFADRSVLATSAPFLQLEGSPWNPSVKPFGPRQTIQVRDMNEVRQLEVRDVPNSVGRGIDMVLSAAERLSGMNDTTTGQLAQADRTLGEVKLVTQQSWIRIDEVVKNFQEGMEDLFLLCLIIWKNKLEVAPEPMPGDLLLMMQQRGVSITDRTVTAKMLEGAFRGKPHGSVEGSDFSQMRADFVQMMTALVQLAQAVPAVKAHLNQPNVIRSIMSQVARMYRWPDRQNLIESFTGTAPPPPAPPAAPGGAPAPPAMPGSPAMPPQLAALLGGGQ